MALEGSCLCEKVKVKIPQTPETFTVCHCISCRKWSGGIAMSVNGGEKLTFSNDELIGRYQSSDWAERGFCLHCGTNLFFRLKKTDHYFLMLGLFGDQISPTFALQESIDTKPACYSFAEDTKTLTKAEGQELLKKYLDSCA